MKNNTLIGIIIIVLVIGIAAFFFTQRQKSTNNLTDQTENIQVEPIDTGKVISVTADKNQLNPKDFSVEQTKALNLRVTAIDHDYQFKVNGYDRIDMTLQKGETTNVLIEALGVGEYTYSCGTGCSGTITVIHEDD
jgi:hypothetical protein